MNRIAWLLCTVGNRIRSWILGASSAVVIAGICAGVFGGLFLIFLVASILLVGGGITNFAVGVIEFTVKLLGFHQQGSLIVVVIFWASIVFLSMLIILVPITMAAARGTGNRNHSRDGNSSLIIVLVFVSMLLIIYFYRYRENAVIEEEQLALNYVTQNNQVIKLAGGPVKAIITSSGSSSGNGKRYEFSIYPEEKGMSAENEIDAIVDVSRSWGKPTFTLACIPPISVVGRDAHEDPCK